MLDCREASRAFSGDSMGRDHIAVKKIQSEKYVCLKTKQISIRA